MKTLHPEQRNAILCAYLARERSKIYYREMNFDEVARLRKIIQHGPNSKFSKLSGNVQKMIEA